MRCPSTRRSSAAARRHAPGRGAGPGGGRPGTAGLSGPSRARPRAPPCRRRRPRRAARCGAGLLLEGMSAPDRLARLAGAFDAAGGTGAKVLIRRVWLGDLPSDLVERQRAVYDSYSGATAAFGGDQTLAAADPGELVDRLVDLVAATGMDALNLRVHLPGMAPDGSVSRSNCSDGRSSVPSRSDGRAVHPGQDHKGNRCSMPLLHRCTEFAGDTRRNDGTHDRPDHGDRRRPLRRVSGTFPCCHCARAWSSPAWCSPSASRPTRRGRRPRRRRPPTARSSSCPSSTGATPRSASSPRSWSRAPCPVACPPSRCGVPSGRGSARRCPAPAVPCGSRSRSSSRRPPPRRPPNWPASTGPWSRTSC